MLWTPPPAPPYFKILVRTLPETDTGDYTQSVDQFAYGCVIIHVLTHKWPDAGSKQGTEFERREHLLNELAQEERHLLPLVRSCLSSPEHRPPFMAIQNQLSDRPHVTDSTRYRIMHGEIERLMERVVPKAEVSVLCCTRQVACMQCYPLPIICTLTTTCPLSPHI